MSPLLSWSAFDGATDFPPKNGRTFYWRALEHIQVSETVKNTNKTHLMFLTLIFLHLVQMIESAKRMAAMAGAKN